MICHRFHIAILWVTMSTLWMWRRWLEICGGFACGEGDLGVNNVRSCKQSQGNSFLGEKGHCKDTHACLSWDVLVGWPILIALWSGFLWKYHSKLHKILKFVTTFPQRKQHNFTSSKWYVPLHPGSLSPPFEELWHFFFPLRALGSSEVEEQSMQSNRTHPWRVDIPMLMLRISRRHCIYTWFNSNDNFIVHIGWW